jgi:hypothetical protein
MVRPPYLDSRGRRHADAEVLWEGRAVTFPLQPQLQVRVVEGERPLVQAAVYDAKGREVQRFTASVEDEVNETAEAAVLAQADALIARLDLRAQTAFLALQARGDEIPATPVSPVAVRTSGRSFRTRVLSMIGMNATRRFLATMFQTTRTFTPTPSLARVELRGLPADRVTIQVNDLRTEKGEDDSLVDVVHGEIERSLAPSDMAAEQERHSLVLDVIEHRAFFDLGNWNGVTRFRARLVTPAGATLGTWEGRGTSRRANTGGTRTSATVAQDSYDAAIADLLSALGGASVP